jgi:hypothetical protein
MNHDVAMDLNQIEGFNCINAMQINSQTSFLQLAHTNTLLYKNLLFMSNSYSFHKQTTTMMQMDYTFTVL